MAALQAAEKAEADFLEANKIATDANAAATQARIEGAVTAIDAKVGATDLAALAGFAVTDNEIIKQAKITTAVQTAESAITVAEAALAAEQAKVDAKPGLKAAAAALKASDAAADDADQALTDATALQEANLAALKTQLGGSSSAAVDSTDNTVADGATDIIVANATTGVLELDKTWAEATTTTPQQLAAAQQLLASINGRVAAEGAKLAIDKAALEASVNVALIENDSTTAAALTTLLGAYDTAIGNSGPASTTVTLKQLKAALDDLLGDAIAQLVPGKEITFNAATFAISNAAADFADVSGGSSPVMDAYNDLQAAIVAYETAAGTPLTTGLSAAETVLETAQDDLEDLLEQIEERDAAVKLLDQWEERTKASDDAFDAFEELGYAEPVVLSGTPVVASSEDDILIAGSVSTKVVNFGLAGDDVLFIGKELTLNTGALKDGDDSVQEVFFIQSGNDTKVVLETKAYGSSEAGVPEVEITLTGVKASDLSLDDDGFITIA